MYSYRNSNEAPGSKDALSDVQLEFTVQKAAPQLAKLIEGMDPIARAINRIFLGVMVFEVHWFQGSSHHGSKRLCVVHLRGLIRLVSGLIIGIA